jgi:hypothetical protein
MVTSETTFQFFWRARRKQGAVSCSIPDAFCSGVSLHSHTMFSEESLEMIPQYTSKLPYVGRAVRRQGAEYTAKRGRKFDFSGAFWTPPLTPRQAYRVEEKQIRRRFQLPALVSLTDHDDIRAPTLLRVLTQFRHAPVSTEWTIPFESTFFHLGIHNLPEERARELHAEMLRYTANPQPKTFSALLERLNSDPQVLVVLNHPLWDEKRIGLAQHREILCRFLQQHGSQIHALELNGLRSWNENKAVIQIGRSGALPLISGGDRHGREPNAILNLSAASSFDGFVEEIRHRGRSHVVFMPQYREPLRLRILQTMVDVVRDYPENMEGRRIWSDRCFYRDPTSGNTQALSVIWKDGGPGIVRQFIRAMRLLEWRGVRSALRLALDDRSWSDGEASI